MTIVDRPDWSNAQGPTGLSTVPIGGKVYTTMDAVGGYNPDNGWTPLGVDESGVLYPVGAQLSSGLVTVPGSGSIDVINAGSFLKSVDVISSVSSDTQGFLYTETVSDVNCIAAWAFDGVGRCTIDLDDMNTAQPIIAAASGAGFKVVLRYRLLS